MRQFHLLRTRRPRPRGNEKPELQHQKELKRMGVPEDQHMTVHATRQLVRSVERLIDYMKTRGRLVPVGKPLTDLMPSESGAVEPWEQCATLPSEIRRMKRSTPNEVAYYGKAEKNMDLAAEVRARDIRSLSQITQRFPTMN